MQPEITGTDAFSRQNSEGVIASDPETCPSCNGKGYVRGRRASAEEAAAYLDEPCEIKDAIFDLIDQILKTHASVLGQDGYWLLCTKKDTDQDEQYDAETTVTTKFILDASGKLRNLREGYTVQVVNNRFNRYPTSVKPLAFKSFDEYLREFDFDGYAASHGSRYHESTEIIRRAIGFIKSHKDAKEQFGESWEGQVFSELTRTHEKGYGLYYLLQSILDGDTEKVPLIGPSKSTGTSGASSKGGASRAQRVESEARADARTAKRRKAAACVVGVLCAIACLCFVAYAAIDGLSPALFFSWAENASAPYVSVAAGINSIGAVRSDGTVEYVSKFGNSIRNEMNQLTGIAAFASNSNTSVGCALRSDGTVATSQAHRHENCTVASWTNIVKLVEGSDALFGLRADGTVVVDVEYGPSSSSDDSEWKVSEWTDVVDIDAGQGVVAGVRSDGTVLSAYDYEDDYSEFYDVSDWNGIVAIGVEYLNIVGLKSDGTVVMTSPGLSHNSFEGPNWTGIVAISSGSFSTLALKSDGTVVASGDNTWGQCDVKDWSDVVAIAAGNHYSVGLTADGMILFAGEWKNISD